VGAGVLLGAGAEAEVEVEVDSALGGVVTILGEAFLAESLAP
jgi:hypothetical protein